MRVCVCVHIVVSVLHEYEVVGDGDGVFGFVCCHRCFALSMLQMVPLMVKWALLLQMCMCKWTGSKGKAW